MFQLYAIERRSNRVLHLVGRPDTQSRTANFGRAHHGVYSPIIWFAVFPAGQYAPGDIIPVT